MFMGALLRNRKGVSPKPFFLSKSFWENQARQIRRSSVVQELQEFRGRSQEQVYGRNGVSACPGLDDGPPNPLGPKSHHIGPISPISPIHSQRACAASYVTA